MELVELPGGGNALLAAGARRLLLADSASRTAWLWVGSRDLQGSHRTALLEAAAQAAGRQSQP
jgi:hypothetical protein